MADDVVDMYMSFLCECATSFEVVDRGHAMTSALDLWTCFVKETYVAVGECFSFCVSWEGTMDIAFVNFQT